MLPTRSFACERRQCKGSAHVFLKKNEHVEEQPHSQPEAVSPLAKLHSRIDEAALPQHVFTTLVKELEKIAKTDPAVAEYSIGFNYIEMVLSLPWNLSSQYKLDLTRAQTLLEALSVLAKKEIDLVITDLKMERMDGIELLQQINRVSPEIPVIMVTGFATVTSAVEALKKGAAHYLGKPVNLDELRKTVKEVLEKKLFVEMGRGPILCFTGPPGTGKTSVGRAIAEALQRQFVRISLAGLRDEAELRGHRRTYVGALPGRIISELKRIGVNNPVFMLDEIDKIGQDFRGDPASVLLEVLDPEQKNLEREVADICRKIALLWLKSEGRDTIAEIDAEAITGLLGPRKFFREAAEVKAQIGIATGLVWTETGGEIISVETAMMPGSGTLILTGSLGDVLQESAQAVLSFIRSRTSELGIIDNFFKDADIHIHFPSGAIPKDGPSAGITIFAALLSLLTRRPAYRDVALTGEMTLSGRILPISGIREKILAAKRAGVRRVLLPRANQEEVAALSPDVTEGIKLVLVANGAEVVDQVLEARQYLLNF